MFLIKDNHITASGSIKNALSNSYNFLKQYPQHQHKKIEIEATNNSPMGQGIVQIKV